MEMFHDACKGLGSYQGSYQGSMKGPPEFAVSGVGLDLFIAGIKLLQQQTLNLEAEHQGVTLGRLVLRVPNSKLPPASACYVGSCCYLQGLNSHEPKHERFWVQAFCFRGTGSRV